MLRQINATEADAQLYGRLAGSVLYAQPALRADAGVLMRNRRGQSGLWSYAISGDLPIVLLQIADAANIDLVRQLVQAHAYWRLKGLVVDLVIWNEDHAGYRQQLQDQIMGLIAAGVEAHADRPAGRHLRAPRRADLAARTASCCKRSRARHHHDSRGTLAEQVERARASRTTRVPRRAVAGARASPGAAAAPRDVRRAPDLRARQRHRRLHAPTAAST